MPTPLLICPECEQGQHANCTEEVPVDDQLEDVWSPCECACRAGLT